MCKCCEEIDFWEKHKPDRNKFKEKLFAKITVYTWIKEERAIKGRQISTVTSKPYNLNYCPMCRKES